MQAKNLTARGDGMAGVVSARIARDDSGFGSHGI
jgi:hypothetical protein